MPNGNGHQPDRRDRKARPVRPGITSQVRPLKQRRFLEAFTQTGNLSYAADYAKVNRQSHYRWLESSEAYREAFERVAREEAVERLELEARRRAVEGWEEPVYQGGQQIGSIRKYSDTLLIFLLKGAAPAKYRERYEIGGPDGGPIPLDVVRAAERFRNRLADLVDRSRTDGPLGLPAPGDTGGAGS